MADQNTPGGPLGDDDELLDNLNLENIEGLSDVQVEQGKQLPKKVELDIDDLLLEDTEEEPPPEKPAEEEPEEKEPTEPSAEEQEEEPPPTPRLSRSKLALILAGALIPIIVVAVLLLMPGEAPPPPQTTKPVVDAPALSELAPFVINFPVENGELLVEMELSVYFSSNTAKTEFESSRIYWRDLIFRYVQGKDPAELKEPETRDVISRELTDLINAGLEHGQARRVQVTRLGAV